MDALRRMANMTGLMYYFLGLERRPKKYILIRLAWETGKIQRARERNESLELATWLVVWTVQGPVTTAPKPASGTGPFRGAGIITGCVLAAAATTMTMPAIGIHVSGPSTVPWPVPCSCLCTPPALSTRSQVSPAAVTVVFAECRSMSYNIS